jgi:hypothetical protein
MAEFKLPTETVELPSKGLLYPENSPLASGTIEMKYMTAKEEDILTNTNYLTNGTAIDKLLESLIVTEGVDFNDLLIGDKNAIMVSARILSYGKDFEFRYKGGVAKADLSTLKPKFLPDGLYANRTNEFEFKLPHSGNTVTFKLLTHKDERNIDKEVEGLQKINKDANPEGSTRLKYMITSVNGTRETAEIRKFVDEFLLARDARELRKFYTTISPDLNMITSIETANGIEEGVEVPVTLNFFWPDLDL